MYNITETIDLFNKTITLLNLTNLIYEVEDDYLETWLAEGIPEGSSIQEVIEMMEVDPYLFQEWFNLATDLLTQRNHEEEEIEA